MNINGVIVFSTGGKVWTYGGNIVPESFIAVVKEDLTFLSSRVFSNSEMIMGTSDLNGNAYFLANYNSLAVLLKYQESDNSKTFEMQIGNTIANNIYASSTSLLVTVLSDLYPLWSVDTDTDYVVFQITLDG